MFQRLKIILAVAVLAALMATNWSCNRLSDGGNVNQAPEVFFVNVPLDNTTFSYAPVVHWSGSDVDGLVSSFEYFDDSSRAGVAAYQGGDATLKAYVDQLPESAWTTTYSNSDTIYLSRSATDSITEQVFMIRAVDNLGAKSPVKVRTFFRTNHPPNAPQVKWALDATLDPPPDYSIHYVIPDTLFWSDTLTTTYPGIGFLWRGTDPDSRELNIIPLQYSWVLVNESTNDTMPYPIMDDSNRVVAFGRGWSPWTSDAQMTFTASNALRANPDFVLDGTYRFRLRVRDDGLTPSDTIADVSFAAVSAVTKLESPDHYDFQHQLLVVDWNAHRPSGNDINGLRPEQQILDFYQQTIHEGLTLAEDLRLAYYNNPNPIPGLVYIPDAIDPNDVQWYTDNELNSSNRVPYDLIRKFKWILVVEENPPTSVPDPMFMNPRLKVFTDYMNAGGQVMMTGRRLFMGVLGVSNSGPLTTGTGQTVGNFLHYYMNLNTVQVKSAASSDPTHAIADFHGVTTTDQYIRSMDVDSAVVRTLSYRGTRFSNLPEIDYFGRNAGSSGYDISTTLFNYYSSTAQDTYNVYNEDCTLLSFDTTRSIVYLQPVNNHTRILNCTRIINVTRNVTAEFIRSDQPSLGAWRIIASVPAGHGAWSDDDVLEVDYTCIPIQPSHDQPVATNFQKIQGVVYYDARRGIYTFIGQTRFRSSLFTFPLSFMKNETVDVTYLPGRTASKVAILLSSQAIFFNAPKLIDVSGGTNR
jgi:hypothetical protein